MLEEKAIQSFKILYKRKFKEELSDNEVLLRANKLIDLYRLLYGSLSLEQIKKMKNANENK